jgi:ADP-ribose pyrophosphatase
VTQKSDKRLIETLVRKNPVYRGKSVDFCVDEILLPNGRTAVRHPVGVVTLELPAGKLDAGEEILSCVKRELHEETGYTAKRIRPLLQYWPTPAFANEVLHLFVAEGLVPGRVHPDADEFLEVVTMPFAKAVGLVRSGKIRDSKTVIGLLACAAGLGARRKTR